MDLLQNFFQLRRETEYNDANAFMAMGLDALVYLDSTDWGNQLKTLFGADTVLHIPSPAQFAPAVLVLGKGTKFLVAFEGTRGDSAWFNYVQRARSVTYGQGGGSCFGPFVDLCNATLPAVLSAVTPGSWVMFTGHSLGAAVAAMMANNFMQSRRNEAYVYAFACPRFGDFPYFANYLPVTYTVDNPIDPVPLLPPIITALIRDNLFGADWGGPFLAPPGRVWPGRVPSQLPGASVMADYVGMAASNIDPRVGSHQTYWYLRELYNVLSTEGQQALADYAALLQGLGLFDPWTQ